MPKKPRAKTDGYHIATERARTPAGYIRCESCRKPLLDHDAQRHHIRYRSHGGTNDAGNLAVLCWGCHLAAHGIKPPVT